MQQKRVILSFLKDILLPCICFFILQLVFIPNVKAIGNINTESSATAEEQQPRNAITIGRGVKYTNSEDRIVSLSITMNKAEKMKVSNNEDFSDAEWQPYKESIDKWKLSEGEGEKTVYVKFQDPAGNESPVYSDQIILDTTPPQDINIIIDEGKLYTNNPKRIVSLTLNVSGASSMKVTNSKKSFPNIDWEPYYQQKDAWRLSSGDGEKKVYAKFKDEAGNVSEIAQSSINLDRKPPQNCRIEIDSGAEYTNHPEGKVHLQLLADGASEMILRSDSPRWEPYQRTKTWNLNSEKDGVKVVAAMFKDQAGNASQAVYSKIILDREPPQNPRIRIDKGALFTNSNERVVMLETRVNKADKMVFSNDKDFNNNAWEPYKPARNDWQLNKEDGVKTVYAKFMDQARNVTEPVSDKIKLDRKPPVNNDVVINGGNEYVNHPDRKVTLMISSKDAYQMRLSNNQQFNGEWELFQDTVKGWQLSEVDGIKHVHTQLKDSAGNTTSVMDEIILDRDPPTNVKLILNGGNNYVNHEEKLIDISIAADNATKMLIGTADSLDTMEWQSFKTAIDNYKLSGSDGIKKIGLRVKDKAGNVSHLITKAIKLDRKPPQNGEIVINNDSVYTNNPDKNATLSIKAEGADYMKILKKDSSGNIVNTRNPEEWIEYKETMQITLPGGDGKKEVGVRFKDEAGNISKDFYDKIILDRKPPFNGKLVINNGEKYVTNKDSKVTLRLSCDSADYFNISNTKNFLPGKWHPFNTQDVKWQIESGDGKKNVFVKFKDKAGNLSEGYQDDIILDTKPPQKPALSNMEEDKFVTDSSKEVSLNITYHDAHQMIIGNSKKFASSSWETPSNKKTWKLPGGDGPKTVYVKTRDEAGNESATAKTEFILDLNPPHDCGLVINNDNKYTNHSDKKVEIRIKAQDVHQMMISEDSTFEKVGWEPFKPRRVYILNGNDGHKKVYAKFRDQAGNVAPQLTKDEIILDRKPPKNIDVIINNDDQYTNNKEKKVTLKLEAEEAEQMLISNNPDFDDAEWQQYTPTVNEWQLKGDDGEKIVYVRFKDAAGNVSDVITDKIILKRKF